MGNGWVTGSKDRRHPSINGPMVTSGAGSDATTAGKSLVPVVYRDEATEPLPDVTWHGYRPLLVLCQAHLAQ